MSRRARPLCALCRRPDEGRVFYDPREARCEDCPSPLPKVAALFAFFLLCVLFVAFMSGDFRNVLLVRAQARTRTLVNQVRGHRNPRAPLSCRFSTLWRSEMMSRRRDAADPRAASRARR